MKRILTSMAVVSAIASTAAAQTQQDQTRALARLQAQIDQLAARVAPEPGVYGSLDITQRVGPWLFVSGWAFDCQAQSAGTIEIELDGVIREALVLSPRVNRLDVQQWAASSGACASAPLASGFKALLNLEWFNPTVIHSARARLKTATGSVPFNTRMFNICATRQDGSYFCQ